MSVVIWLSAPPTNGATLNAVTALTAHCENQSSTFPAGTTWVTSPLGATVIFTRNDVSPLAYSLLQASTSRWTSLELNSFTRSAGVGAVGFGCGAGPEAVKPYGALGMGSTRQRDGSGP